MNMAPPPDIRAQVRELRETFPWHKFAIVGERSIEVTRRDDTARPPGWLSLPKLRVGSRHGSTGPRPRARTGRLSGPLDPRVTVPGPAGGRSPRHQQPRR